MSLNYKIIEHKESLNFGVNEIRILNENANSLDFNLILNEEIMSGSFSKSNNQTISKLEDFSVTSNSSESLVLINGVLSLKTNYHERYTEGVLTPS